MQTSDSYSIYQYLQIDNSEFKDFLISLPLYTDKTQSKLINNEFLEDDFFSVFKFKDIEYEICLKQGARMYGPDNSLRKIPLPNIFDNLIKKILIKSISLKFDMEGFKHFGEQETNYIILFLMACAQDQLKLMNISENDIKNSLMRLSSISINIREKGFKEWIKLPWMLAIPSIYIEVEYSQLGHHPGLN